MIAPSCSGLTRLVRSGVKTLLSVLEIWDSNPGSVKSDTVSPTACHSCDVSSKVCCSFALVQARSYGDGPRHSLRYSGSLHEYDEDLFFFLDFDARNFLQF